MIGLRSPHDDQYDGSRMFLWLANLCGLTVDVTNFLICQMSGLVLAALFRSSLLHRSRTSAACRHAFGLLIGMCFAYLCFGRHAIHIVALPAVCYIVLRTANPKAVQHLVLVVAMAYLSAVHLHRTYFDYGSTTIDITGALMMVTQKVTALAFHWHDGYNGSRRPTLSARQRHHAVYRLPGVLAYFAYCLHFHGLLAGPVVQFKDYMDFIEGTNWQRQRHHNDGGGGDDGTPSDEASSCGRRVAAAAGVGVVVNEPSPMRAVGLKMLGSVLCAFVYMKFGAVYPIRTLKDADFLSAGTSCTAKLWFVMNAVMFVRFKYYHAWLMGDAICNMAGLGFNGYDASGRPQWDLVSNIDILGFEFATNFRDSIGSWNMATNRWLRHIAYERVPRRYGTLLTFGLSAVWHGFYPGYYMTFATGALMVTAARTMRKHMRHRFQHTAAMRRLYDAATVVVTRVCMAYATFPFVLLEFQASVDMYLSVYMCLHLIAVATICLVPSVLVASLPLGNARELLVIDTAKTRFNGSRRQTVTSNGVCSEPKPLTTALNAPDNCDIISNSPKKLYGMGRTPAVNEVKSQCC